MASPGDPSGWSWHWVSTKVPQVDLELSESSKNLLKYALITGSAVGAVSIGITLLRWYLAANETKVPIKELPVNGIKVGTSVDTRNVKTATAELNQSEADIFDEGDASLQSCQAQLPPRSYASSSSSRSRGDSFSRHRRRRSDSVASGSTTLLFAKRNPSELTLYALEALKRAVKLFEELKVKLQESNEDANPDSELEFIISKAKQLVDDVNDYKTELTPERDNEIDDHHNTDDARSTTSSYDGTFASSITLPYYDIEPNIHFFKLYTQALESINSIAPPRVDRSVQLHCESDTEFFAKVHCLREAFSEILKDEESCRFFMDIGSDILNVLLNHSLQDPTDCLTAYNAFIVYVASPENAESLIAEVATRNIPCLSFYDLVLDYIIMDSFDDLSNPPSAVLSVANNRWLSPGFRELALQTAVSAVLRHKRSKLANSDGFFAHFYGILDYISPILAWGFLGSDYDLKFKCNLIKDSISELICDYFSFDRVRYTSLPDLCCDILRLTEIGYDELQRKLSVCK